MNITHFIVEMLDGKTRVVASATCKAYAQNGVAEIDPAGRRDLRVVELAEWFEVPVPVHPRATLKHLQSEAYLTEKGIF